MLLILLLHNFIFTLCRERAMSNLAVCDFLREDGVMVASSKLSASCRKEEKETEINDFARHLLI
jgi:hypothetical protein